MEGRIENYFHPRDALLISHLLYVDGHLLAFSNGEKRSIRMILNTLELYGSWSRQAFNKDKPARFMLKKIPSECERSPLRGSGFVEGNFPTKYLGAPLFPGRMTAHVFEPLQLKTQNKMAN